MQSQNPLSRRKPRGFTLIEAMMVVTVISVLASISITVYEHYLIQSKNAEVTVMSQKIRDAEVVYFLKPRLSAGGIVDIPPCFLAAGRTPAVISSQKRPWVDTQGGFSTLGVASSSPVYYSYQVSRPNGQTRGFCDTPDSIPLPPAGGNSAAAFIVAEGDLNSDGVISVLGSLKMEDAMGQAIGPGCPGFDPDRVIAGASAGTSYFEQAAGFTTQSLFLLRLSYTATGQPGSGPLVVGAMPAGSSCTP